MNNRKKSTWTSILFRTKKERPNKRCFFFFAFYCYLICKKKFLFTYLRCKCLFIKPYTISFFTGCIHICQYIHVHSRTYAKTRQKGNQEWKFGKCLCAYLLLYEYVLKRSAWVRGYKNCLNGHACYFDAHSMLFYEIVIHCVIYVCTVRITTFFLLLLFWFSVTQTHTDAHSKTL